MLRIALILTVFLNSSMLVLSQTISDQISKAKEEGKSIFLIVYDKESKTRAADLENLAKKAQLSAKKTKVISFDRGDKANSGLVKKYRLKGIELPSVLVMAYNGTISGSLSSSETTIEKLLEYLPTPSQAEVLAAFDKGQAAFIICAKKFSKDKEGLQGECKKAAATLNNKAVTIVLDVNDPSEKNFLDLLTPDVNRTSLLVFNSKGQNTGTLAATATSAEILKCVRKKISGCCPNGSSTGCGK